MESSKKAVAKKPRVIGNKTALTIQRYLRSYTELRFGHSLAELKRRPDLVRRFWMSTEPEVRAEVVRFLSAYVPYEEALPEIIAAAVGDPSESVRRVAIACVSMAWNETNDPRAGACLTAICQNRTTSPKLRDQAFHSLSLPDNKEPFDPLRFEPLYPCSP